MAWAVTLTYHLTLQRANMMSYNDERTSNVPLACIYFMQVTRSSEAQNLRNPLGMTPYKNGSVTQSEEE